MAEMEAQKASNMMEHQDEIQARPPRTWFQTPKEKKAAAEAARLGPDKADKAAKAKKGGQDKAALKGKRKREREAEEHDSKSKRQHLREVSAGEQIAGYRMVGPGRAWSLDDMTHRCHPCSRGFGGVAWQSWYMHGQALYGLHASKLLVNPGKKLGLGGAL